MPRFCNWLASMRRNAALIVGMPDYDAYVAHQRTHHPETEPMSRAAFARDRTLQRYGGGDGKISRCC